MLIESMNFTIPATILLTLDDVVEGGDLVDGQAGPGQEDWSCFKRGMSHYLGRLVTMNTRTMVIITW